MTLQKSYVPAAGHDWLLWTYDPWVKVIGADVVRSTLPEQMALAPGYRVFDIGCGTGSLVVLLKQLYRDVIVVGVDPDHSALARAMRKAQRGGVDVTFVRVSRTNVPTPMPRLTALMRQAGFADVRKTGDYPMWLWPLASYRALAR